MSRQRSMRVAPEYVAALIAFVSNDGIKVDWTKKDHDSHTLFEGSTQAINQVRAFIKGWEACKDSTAYVDLPPIGEKS